MSAAVPTITIILFVIGIGVVIFMYYNFYHIRKETDLIKREIRKVVIKQGDLPASKDLNIVQKLIKELAGNDFPKKKKKKKAANK